MDDLSEKRIEKDLEKFGAVATDMLSGIDAQVSRVGDLASLEVEYNKRAPEWARNLLTMPGTLITFSMSRLHSIGAPAGYMLQLLGSMIDETAPRLWPQPGAEPPAWLQAATGPACRDHDIGSITDMGEQVVRILDVVYDEIRSIMEADAVRRGELDPDPNVRNEAAERAARERALELITFHTKLFSGLLIPL